MRLRISTFELERPGKFGNWQIGIARNKLLRWHQNRRRDATLAEMCAAVAATAAPVLPEDVAVDRLELADGLARLTPRARRALMLHHAADMPRAEVALALGTNKRAVSALAGWARSQLRGEARLCACGCGDTIRPERWGRDRFATPACARRVAAAAPVLCACGCGAALPDIRAHNRRYATVTCRNRAAWRRRQEAERRYLAGPVTADPAVERLLAIGLTGRQYGLVVVLLPIAVALRNFRRRPGPAAGSGGMSDATHGALWVNELLRVDRLGPNRSGYTLAETSADVAELAAAMGIDASVVRERLERGCRAVGLDRA